MFEFIRTEKVKGRAGRLQPTKYPKAKPRWRKWYGRLAFLMQKAEADFMLRTVCYRLARHHPEVPCVTIHDIILTYKRYCPLVRRIIMEEFRRLGVRPTLK
jgi:hypothetical protein